MKKSLIALTLLTAVFFSCKKTTTTELVATDVTGTAVLRGTLTKNIITPNGSGGWVSTSKIPAAGVSVQARVNKNQLYPNSIAQGADVYSATSDANGYWSMSIKTNATGVNPVMTINGFNSTLDTVINGVTKTGLYANFFGTSPSPGTIFVGVNKDMGVYNFVASNLTSNPNNIMIGSAVVSGSVALTHWLKTRTTGTAAAVAFGTTNTAIPAGATVYLSFDQDPTILTDKMYTTTTGAGGYYSITLATVPMSTPGFTNQIATIWVADYTGSKDSIETIDGGAGNSISSKPGVFGNVSNTQNALWNNEVRNNAHMTLNTFTAN